MSQGSAVAAQQAISIRVSRSGSAVVRRACDCGEHTTGGGECEECRKKRKVLQRKTASVSAPSIAPAFVHEALSSPGFALGQGSLDFFQPRLDRDFSSVRVHTGEKEAASASALGARAYTVGRDIVFATGQFAPESRDGRWLLAHELAHVAQQADGSVGRAPQALEVGSPGDPLEREADLIANAITGPQLHASGKSETSAGAEGPGRMPIHRALMRVQRAGGDEKTKQAGGTQHHSAAPTHGTPAPGTRVDAFGKECPDTVSIGALKAAPTFEKKMLDAGFKTYLATEIGRASCRESVFLLV